MRGADAEARSGRALCKASGLSGTGRAGPPLGGGEGGAEGRPGVAGWPGHAPRGALGQHGRPRVRFSPAAEKSLVFGEVRSGVLPGVETRQVRLSR